MNDSPMGINSIFGNNGTFMISVFA